MLFTVCVPSNEGKGSCLKDYKQEKTRGECIFTHIPLNQIGFTNAPSTHS